MSDNYYPRRVRLEVEVYVQVDVSDVQDARESMPGLSDHEIVEALGDQKARESVGLTISWSDDSTELETKRVTSSWGL
ncbi:hypothetical protein SEA_WILLIAMBOONE_167 [Gordonia phage WilliamBoone]|nr:hypothetical protein SEA_WILLIAMBOONE_167 [Gordonia phage WilliamBoone]